MSQGACQWLQALGQGSKRVQPGASLCQTCHHSTLVLAGKFVPRAFLWFTMPSATSPVMDVTVPPPAEATMLPTADSPHLKLLPATPKEARQASMLNSGMWSGPLAMPDYLRREEHLTQQKLAREGGLTTFILVDSTQPEDSRHILSACETLRKRALVVEGNGRVEDVVSHGIGSVFCRSEYRGRGYAQRMIQELRSVLEQWQQEPGEKARFNVLYSDIGKNFYAKEGWLPFPSSHISLPPQATPESAPNLPALTPLHSEHMSKLCQADEQMLRAGLERFSKHSTKTRVALLPDVDVMQWHHARENFLAQKLHGKTPTLRGVQVGSATGSRVWAIWTRTFSRDSAENTLHILRIVIEDEDCYMELHEPHDDDRSHEHGNGHSNATTGNPIHYEAHSSNGQEQALANGHGRPRARTSSETRLQHIRAVAACLQAAQAEAVAWGMAQVDVWNPSSTVLAAARSVHADIQIVHRDMESIASLLWYGPKRVEDVEWVCNEKFGWC